MDVPGNTSAPSVKYSLYIDDRAIEALTTLPTADQKLAFAKALKRSITLDIDGNIPLAPSSVEDIAKLHGFSPRIQREFGLALNKQEAKKFLANFGYPVNKSFDKLYSKTEYHDMFGKEPTIINKRQILLTYAEWLHLVNFEFQPEIPDSIASLLK